MEKGAGQGAPGQKAQTGTQGNTPNQAPSPGAKVKVENGHLPALGKKDAKVTVIEFADFQCPFCERFFKDAGAGIKKDYVDTGKVKFIFRHYAFLGQESTWAAQASECANEQEKFWEYHDYLYAHQSGENQGTFSDTNLKSFAKNLGLDTTDFNKCLDENKYAQAVADSKTEGGKAGVTGTPKGFILKNGKIVDTIDGAEPLSMVKQKIDSALR